jgi:mutual gliding-motility protein MglA
VRHPVDHPADALRIEDLRLLEEEGLGQVRASLWSATFTVNTRARALQSSTARGTPMVFYNASTRELTAKIVYYGPGLGGKTTNLQVLHRRLDPGTAGELLALSTDTDRTIYFDLLPVELGEVKGYTIRFQLATVPGQTAFNETRKVVLQGADGVVFVADSQWTMLPKNLESWQSLRENLVANGLSLEGMPVVVQYNKRDLPDILSVEAMDEALGFSAYPHVEAIAREGPGVTETFKMISKLTFLDLLKRLQGRSPAEVGPAPPLPGEVRDTRPPLTLVRPEPDEPAPNPGAPPPVPEGRPLEPPFAEAEEAATVPPAVSRLESRVEALEALVGDARSHLGREMTDLAHRMDERLDALEESSRAEVVRTRRADESLVEEFGRLRERIERLEDQAAAFARDFQDLQRSLADASADRDPGELKLQLAPLLEERVRREADENWTAEIERLRQALAESLDDLSERVRKAVRG